MTTENLSLAAPMIINGIGPYQIPHEYNEGAIECWVVKDGALSKILDTEFGTSPERSETSGNVYLTPVAATAYDQASLLIVRNTEVEQGWVGVNGSREKSLELQMDIQARAIQELQIAAGQSLRGAPNRGAINFLAADPGERSGRVLIFDDAGHPVPGPNADEISSAQSNAQIATSAASAASAAQAAAAAAQAAAAAASIPYFSTASDVGSATVSGDVIVVGGVTFTRKVGGAVADASGATFAPVSYVTPAMFGAVGDGVADDRAAVQAAWDYAAANGIPCRMQGLEYNCSEAVNTRSNLTVLGEWAVMYVTAWPTVGGFVHNVVLGDVNARVQSNIRIEQLIVDGSKLPPPVGQNSNLLGFARGASNVRIVDCIARKMRDGSGGGTGGGGFGVEQGGENIEFNNCIAEDCYRGFRVAGIPGNHADAAGQSKRAVNIRVNDFTARRCGTAVLGHSIGHTGDDQSDLGIFDCAFDGLYIEDCGHYAWREHDAVSSGIPNQKTGCINLGGAQNIRFRNVRVKINSGYPASFTDFLGRTGYPAFGNYIGAGLSGKIGAIVWGWGRNVVFEDISIDGSFEHVWKCARAITYGDLATVSPTDGATGTVSQVVFESIRFVRPGVYDYVFDGQAGLDNGNMSAVINMVPSSNPALGIVGPNGTSGLSNVAINFTSNTGATQRGSVVDWLAFGNARPSSPQRDFTLGGMDLGGAYASDGSRVGKTYAPVSGVMRSSQNATGNKYHYAFYNPNGLVGGLTTSGTSTALVTSSDARLKSDLRDFDGLAMLRAIGVHDFAWEQGGRGVGVMAQQLAEICPDAVSPGDSDDDWNAKSQSERIPFTVDYSKLVPLLIRAVQQMSVMVEALKTELSEGET